MGSLPSPVAHKEHEVFLPFVQRFPDGWAESLSDAQRYKALGNAVTVNVAEWIAKRLIKEM